MITKSSLDLTEANRALAACLSRAEAQQANVSIAIVDDAAQLLCFGRMDGARAYTVEFASRKARVAASVGVSTAIITEMSARNPGQASEAAVGAGGLPIAHEGRIVGGIGVSGARPDIDEFIAAAGSAVIA